MFAFRLASQLRRPVAELLGLSSPGGPLSSAEFSLWAAYYRANGFDADRIEWASANAGAAAARSMGSDVKPKDLVPKFDSVPVSTQRAMLIASLEGLG